MRITASRIGLGSVATSMAPSPSHLATRTPRHPARSHDRPERRQRRNGLAHAPLVRQHREPAEVDEGEVAADQRIGVVGVRDGLHEQRSYVAGVGETVP